jgi:DNA polymerase (family X)
MYGDFGLRLLMRFSHPKNCRVGLAVHRMPSCGPFSPDFSIPFRPDEMNNSKIADHLETLADLLEFQGANSFRTNAYRNGARRIRQLSDSIEGLIADEFDLTTLEGIGKSVSEKCHELVERGKLRQIEEILETVPPSVLDLLKVPKLGPKKAAALFQQLNIATLDQLKAACEAHLVQELPGFGAKSEQAILDGIAIAAAANERILWAEADQIVTRLREHFSSCLAIQQIEFGGSYRRGKETVGDLDILVDASDADSVMDRLTELPGLASIIGRGPSKMSIRLETGFAIDLRVVPHESFGAALQYFTGNKEHNVTLRKMAKEKALKLNEWGVFPEDDSENSIAGKTEEEVYRVFGMDWIPPELRENRGEIEWALRGEIPSLLEQKQIRGDLHMHTTATDGAASIAEMAAAARAAGYEYIAITDHSKRVSMAHGLDENRLLAQWREIDELNATFDGKFLVLKGIECDILEAGGMDLSDEVLSQADWVIASIHYGQNQPMAQITARIIGALENPYVSVIAHPTGRLLNRRDPYEVDMHAVMKAAVQYQKLLELNASPRRLDLSDVHLIAARELKIPIVINTDAHHPNALSDMRFGVVQARRAALSADHVANTLPWNKLKKLIGRKS